jgi:epoxyqueuosine reductase
VSPEERALRVKDCARKLGFNRCGITDLSPTPHRQRLSQWLEDGFAGTMTYMHRQARKRREPAEIVPGATRAVVLTRDYYNPDPPPDPQRGKVAKYAQGTDYHRALHEPLQHLAGDVIRLGGAGTIAQAFVDAGPVPERELAQRAGLGWIGKNTMLIDPRRGSFLFIASIFTDADLALDPPFESDRCGSCRACLDACPTEAFADERELDSRLCISYLTIEYGGEIDATLASQMDGWIFGCDVCQDACPWNHKFAAPANDPVLGHDPQWASIDLKELTEMTDGEFDRRFGETAMERPGANGMRRNARIALEAR